MSSDILQTSSANIMEKEMTHGNIMQDDAT